MILLNLWWLLLIVSMFLFWRLLKFYELFEKKFCVFSSKLLTNKKFSFLFLCILFVLFELNRRFRISLKIAISFDRFSEFATFSNFSSSSFIDLFFKIATFFDFLFVAFSDFLFFFDSFSNDFRDFLFRIDFAIFVFENFLKKIRVFFNFSINLNKKCKTCFEFLKNSYASKKTFEFFAILI